MFVFALFKDIKKSTRNTYTFTPNKYPTPAEIPIAKVPPIVIRNTAFPIGDPPVLADKYPNRIKNKMVDP